ncbi:MAG: ATP phosphoribosyltransferase regulatory subunit [Nitrospirae bacterium RBG_16_64_22]|nr:MAG: ATP phosphoribosyltransferase regulatory subunit [Nitrospirae bacterium RBG_16_64_22]
MTLRPDAAARRRAVEGRLLTVFREWGCEEIIPATFEYRDVLAPGMEEGLAESCYTLTDRESGRLLLLRPDVTLQIARMAGSARRGALPLPARYCYTTSVYRYEKDPIGRHRELRQAGVEILGVSGAEGSAEAVALCVEALRRTGLKEFKVAVGQVEFFRGLFQGQKVPPEIRAEIREAVSKKDDAALDRALLRGRLAPRAAGAFRKLPELFGKAEVLAEASRFAVTPAAKAALRDVRRTAEQLDAYGVLPFVVFDLGEIRGFDYYTGVLFEAFAGGVGTPIGRGGQYDNLIARFGSPCRATGFALDVDLVAQALGEQGVLDRYAEADVLLVGSRSSPREALDAARRLRRKGFRVACDLDGGGIENAVKRAAAGNVPSVVVLKARKGEALVVDVETRKRRAVSARSIEKGLKHG